ncbi:MAG: zinc ribbon domain-containing protein [Eubacteriales bacterium]
MADDFGKKIERFGQDIWKKTSDAVGAIGKSAESANKKHELRTVYADIGEAFFKKHPAQAKDEFAELYGRAEALETEISALEEQILEQRGHRKCVSCGEQIAQNAAFCPKCGTAQPAAKEEPAEEAEVISDWVCPTCGVKNDSDAKFCVACGVKRL